MANSSSFERWWRTFLPNNDRAWAERAFRAAIKLKIKRPAPASVTPGETCPDLADMQKTVDSLKTDWLAAGSPGDWTEYFITRLAKAKSESLLGYCERDHFYESPTMDLGQPKQRAHAKQSGCVAWHSPAPAPQTGICENSQGHYDAPPSQSKEKP